MWAHIESDCVTALRRLEDNSIDSIVTDPPYALSFMGKDWDSFGDGKGYQAWCEDWARECLRVLKPGGHMLAFGGTRTYHRLTCAIEDAGFEIRDSLHWIYGSGFPKSLDVSKAIDKAAGAEREVIGEWNKPGRGKRSVEQKYGLINDSGAITAPSTDDAKKWQGWGTALKPAHEPIVWARKPFKGTVAGNVLEHGTGAINVDGCRINYASNESAEDMGGGTFAGMFGNNKPAAKSGHTEGRWPPNILLSHSPYCIEATETLPDGGIIGKDECSDDCPVAEMDRQSGKSKSTNQPRRNTMDAHNKTSSMGKSTADWTTNGYNDTGGASRFFPVFRYNPKAPKKERPVVDGKSHSTVKPVPLMRWLVRLVTPPDGLVLDLFGGTGPTAEACILEGFDCLLIDNDPMSVKWCNKRMEKYADKEKGKGRTRPRPGSNSLRSNTAT